MAFIYKKQAAISDIDAGVALKHFHAWGISKLWIISLAIPTTKEGPEMAGF